MPINCIVSPKVLTYSMAAPQITKTRVAIIGAGICGLTCALALSRGDCSSIEVDVYEAASQLAERGAGITIWHRTWDILKELGLEPDMRALLPYTREDKPTLTFQFRKGDQAKGFGFYELITNGGPINFHRADFQQIFLKHIPDAFKDRFHLSRRLVSYTESPDEVQLQFSDGTTATCDLLIAADGIKSTARRILLSHLAEHASGPEMAPEDFTQSMEPIWTGWVAYRGFAPVDVLEAKMPGHRAAKRPIQYWGKNKHIVAYPIYQSQEQKLVNVVALCSDMTKEGTPFAGPWVTEVPTEDVATMFSGWDAEVQVLFESFAKASRWAVHAVKLLKTYVSNRVALMGDAAHAMSPHQGAGAGQAIEDAYILASLLVAAPPHIPHILQIYDTIRQPRATRVQADSRTQGMAYEFNAPGFEDVGAGGPEAQGEEMDEAEHGLRARLAALAEELVGRWEWLWTESAEGDRTRALDALAARTLRDGTSGTD